MVNDSVSNPSDLQYWIKLHQQQNVPHSAMLYKFMHSSLPCFIPFTKSSVTSATPKL